MDNEPRLRLLRMPPFAFGFFAALGALVAYGLSLAAVQARSILLTILLALFLALGLNKAVEFLVRRRWPRLLSLVVVFAMTLLVVALAVWAVAPIFTSQVNALFTNLPGYLTRLRQNPQINDLDARFQVISKAIEYLTSGALLSSVFGGLWGAGRLIASTVFDVLITLVLTMYFLASLPTLENALFRLAPASRRQRVRDIAEQIFDKVGSYLGGMFIVVSCAGVCAFIALTIMGMGAYALALAVMVALLTFIPLIGASINLVAVGLVAFATSPTTGIAWVVYYLIYAQIEGYVILPRVMVRSVEVPAAMSVVAALIFGTLFGLVGAVMAVPTAAVLLLLYREVLVPRLDAS